jgi:hypothetical protein
MVNNPFAKHAIYLFEKEDKLLMSLCNVTMADNQLMYIEELLQEPLHWDYLLERASSHRITPLIYYTLQNFGLLAYLPDTVQNDMQKTYLESLASNLAYFDELQSILEKYAVEKLEMLVLKGAVLGQILYEDKGVRPFIDIDILVHRNDLGRVRKCMEDLGYRICEENRPIHFYDTYHFHHVYTKNADFANFTVEIHWDLFSPHSPLQFDLPSLWENKITFSTNTSAINTLSWEDHFLYLCSLYCITDGFNSLLQLYDLVLIARTKLTNDSWHSIENKAARLGIKHVVTCCISLIEALSGEPLPHLRGFQLTRSQEKFTKSIFHYRNIIQHYSNRNWTIRPLLSLLLLNQSMREFLKEHLFPGERKLYPGHYDTLQKTTATKNIFLFIKGVRDLVLIGCSYLKFRFLLIYYIFFIA